MRGLVSVDWMIGIAIFLVFTSFAIIHTTRMVPTLEQPLEDGAGLIADRIMDNLTVGYQSVPVSYDSAGPAPGSVMYLDFAWPYGKNTTQVFQGSSALPCMIEDSRLYWQADLIAGINEFIMSFRDEGTALNCSDVLPTAGANQTIPGSGQPGRLISQSSIDQMKALDYSEFKSGLGLANDFRVVLNISGSESTYGPETPLTSNVYASTRWGQILETGETGTIRVLVW